MPVETDEQRRTRINAARVTEDERRASREDMFRRDIEAQERIADALERIANHLTESK